LDYKKRVIILTLALALCLKAFTHSVILTVALNSGFYEAMRIKLNSLWA